MFASSRAGITLTPRQGQDTDQGQDKTVAMSQTTFSKVFSWWKMMIHVYWLKFHWSLFLGVQLTVWKNKKNPIILAQLMAWQQISNKPLSDPSMPHQRSNKPIIWPNNDLLYCPGGNFKNTYELSNLRAHKISMLTCIKMISFNEWVWYFVWNFKWCHWNSTQNILAIHWKM